MTLGKRCLFVTYVIAVAMIQVCASAQDDSSGDWPKPEEVDPNGRPEGALTGTTARIYVFIDRRGWNVVTTSRGVAKFTGKITVDQGTIRSAVDVGVDRNAKSRDVLRLDESKKFLEFEFTTGGKADGFYFPVSRDVKQIHFDLKPPGQRLKQRIFIGKELVHPKQLPFVLNVPE